MMYKKKYFDLLVIGSGLSSLTFAKTYLKKKKVLNIISPIGLDINKKKFLQNKKLNEHVYKILPQQMIGQDLKIKNYFYENNISLNKKTKIYGSLEFGGLSNYWGLQIDKDIKTDIKNLKTSTKKKIVNSFYSLFSDNSLLTKNYKKNNFIIEYPILGLLNNNFKNYSLENTENNKKILNPKNYYRKHLKNKKIIFHNYCVTKIFKKGGLIYLDCTQNKKKVLFISKKVVFGCGTIITTKLIMDYLNVKKEVKIKHHPRFLSVYIAKKKWTNINKAMNLMPSIMHLKYANKKDLFTADFRLGNKSIIDGVIRSYKILSPLKPFLNFFKKNLIFSNIFLNSKYSNLYMKLKNDQKVFIYSKKRNLKDLFKSIAKNIFKFLNNENLVFSFYKNQFPGYGFDFHYFGTIPFNNKGKLSVNENCELKNNKNIYIIDGSVFDFKKNKYPIGLIMANAKRIAENIV